MGMMCGDMLPQLIEIIFICNRDNLLDSIDIHIPKKINDFLLFTHVSRL